MNDLRAIRGWLGHEMRLLLSAAHAPELWIALAVALLLWNLAYQAPINHTLRVGGDPATQWREHDAPFLSGVNASEPESQDGVWYEAAERPYRWTEPQAEVFVPGVGGGAWIVRVVASGGPRAEPVTSAWQFGDATPAVFDIAPGQPRARVYHLLGPASGGDVRLGITTPPLDAPADRRSLGIVLHQITVSPAGNAPRAPDWRTLALLGVTLAGVVTSFHRLAANETATGREDALGSRRSSGRSMLRPYGILLLLALAAAWILATQRVDLTIFAPALAALVWVCYLIAALLAPLVGTAARGLGLSVKPGEREVGAAAASLAFGLRMGGMLNPYAIFSDTGLHLNNLVGLSSQVIGVTAGGLLFTEGLPCEAGGGQSPYPPGPYLALAPGLLATGPGHLTQRWVVQGGVALFESVSAALIWLLLRRFGRVPALLGALLYAFAPPLLRAYSVGEMANLFAQALVVPLLVLLAAWGRRFFGLGVALLALVLLSHTGVSISAAALAVAWIVINGTRRHEGTKARRREIVRLVAAGAVAVAIALGVYYSAYGWLLVNQRAAAASVCPPATTLVDRLQRWTVPFVMGDWPALPGALLLAGAVGAVVAMRRAGTRESAVSLEPGSVLLACWLGTVLSFGTLLRSDQAVRWPLFLFPALCLGTGVALGALWRRGSAGRLMVIAAAAFLCWYAAADWVRQIGTYLH